MTTMEAVAVLFGLMCVGFTIRQSIWCWPTGLAHATLHITISKQATLNFIFACVFLEFYFGLWLGSLALWRHQSQTVERNLEHSFVGL